MSESDEGADAGEAGGGPADPPATDPDPGLGARLNDEGYALVQQGQAAEAVPILRRAVNAYGQEPSGLEYGYALFNLATALRQAGRPAEAIPLLRERLRIPDQTQAVQAELEAAIAAAR